MSLFKYVEERTKIDGPLGWVQWKGTDVCVDICCACGAQYHFDGDFMYHVKCSACDRVWAVGAYVRLVEVPEEYRKEAEESCCHLLKDHEP